MGIRVATRVGSDAFPSPALSGFVRPDWASPASTVLCILPSPLSLFVSCVYFAVVILTAQQSARLGKRTTAKDANDAKVKTKATTHLKRDPSLNPATVRDKKASTAINEDAGKRKPSASIFERINRLSHPKLWRWNHSSSNERPGSPSRRS